MGKVLSGELSCPCDRSCFFSPLFLVSPWEIVQNRLKQCVKELLYPKKPIGQNL